GSARPGRGRPHGVAVPGLAGAARGLPYRRGGARHRGDDSAAADAHLPGPERRRARDLPGRGRREGEDRESRAVRPGDAACRDDPADRGRADLAGRSSGGGASPDRRSPVAMPANSDEPLTPVIFGASGVLPRRKLVPALWSLCAGRALPEPFAIIGSARSEVSDDEFRRRMNGAVREFARVKPPSANVWDRFASSLSYVNGDPADPALYASLERALRDIEKARPGRATGLFYLAPPPSLYDAIVENLGAAGLARPQGGFTRVIVEKPFGHDYESARELNSRLARVFREEQIYRI